MPLSDLDNDFENALRKNPMHSHDRTLLSKLGFADLDKKNPLHDQACLYITQPEMVKKIEVWLLGKAERTNITNDLASFGYEPQQVVGYGSTEFHLQKGEGQYATTIGFLDALFFFQVKGVVKEWETKREETVTRKYGISPREYVETSYQWVDCEPYQKSRQTTKDNIAIFAEVKIQPTSVGDILRQMKLYRDYLFTHHHTGCGLPLGILFSPWDLSAAEADALHKARFAFLKLGSNFDEWRKKATEVKSQAMEL